MNSNNRSLWIIIVILIVINIASLGSFWIMRGQQTETPGSKNTRGIDRAREFGQGHYIPKRLRFSAEQTEAFNTMAQSHRTQLIGVMGEIKSLREQLMDEVGSKDKGSSDDLINRIGQKHQELEKINFEHFRKVMQLCEGEQKVAFRRLMRRGFRRMHGMDRSKPGESPHQN